MSFRIGKLLKKHKTIWTKIEDFQNIESNILLVYDCIVKDCKSKKFIV